MNYKTFQGVPAVAQHCFSCGIGHNWGSDLIWELPYAAAGAIKWKKKRLQL